MSDQWNEDLSSNQMCAIRENLPEDTLKTRQARIDLHELQKKRLNDTIVLDQTEHAIKKTAKELDEYLENDRKNYIKQFMNQEIKNKSLNNTINNIKILSEKYLQIRKEMIKCVCEIHKTDLKYKTIEYIPEDINKPAKQFVEQVLSYIVNKEDNK